MTDAFVVFQLVVKYLLFRRGFGVVDYFAHMEDQSVNEIIVEFLVTVENETQQIQIHHAFRHLLQLLHGVIVHQCSVVGDTTLHWWTITPCRSCNKCRQAWCICICCVSFSTVTKNSTIISLTCLLYTS